MNGIHRLLWFTCTLLLLPASPATAADVRLQGTILDADSEKPLPGRVYIRSETGDWHFVRSSDEEGSAIEYRKQRGPESLEMHTTISAHPFETQLPPGTYTLTVERGKEYLPVMKTVTVADEPVELRIELKRWINLAERGWYSGDTHVHRTLEELPNLLAVEDLNVALPLTHWVTRSHTPPSRGDKNTDTAAPARLITVDPTHVIYPLNTEYEIFTVNDKRHTLGAVFILNHKQPLELGAPPVTPIAEAARRQNALLDLDKHSWPWSLMLVPVMNVDLYELANNHVWRTEFFFKHWTVETRPDYLDVESDEDGMTERGWVDYGLGLYYTLLNCGFRLRPTAGTASGVHPVPLGFGRVYVQLEESFDYDRWIKGLDAGRSFVTTGPMLFARFNGRPPGATFADLEKPRPTCRITGTAESATPLDRIEIVVNGEIVNTLKPRNQKTARGGYSSHIDTAVELDGSSWVAVRCWEQHPGGRFRYAHTAPVHFDVPGRPLRPRRAEVRYLISRMEEELARNEGVLQPAELEEFRRALAVYKKLAETAR